ncbi:MAG: apolipoprotein N-acyltransferase [Gammaproteobacteria bacterium]|nr:apolipoprotein N-acyltransferase [Gammaproteobacteria bacterium]
MPAYAQRIIVAIAGAILVGAFAPFSYWWLTLICPALLYVSIINRSALDAFLLSIIFGLFFFGFGVPWTFNSIHEFGHAPIFLSAFLASLLVIVLTLFPAFSTYIFCKLRCNAYFSFTSALAFSSLWALFEWLRSWIFTGFPWLLLGHAHHSSPLQDVIPIFGTYGATWLALLVSCLVVVIALGKFRQKVLALISLALVALSLMVANQITWTQAEDEELSIALVQGNISQEMKWDRTNHPFIMSKYMQLSEAHLDADIIVWPETAIPTYYTLVKDSFIKELSETAQNNNVDFLVGVFTYDPSNGKVFNSVMALGEGLSFYQKQHLVPFGEYIPFRGLISFLDRYIQIPMEDLSEGEGRPLVSLKGHPVGASICYEAVYGNEVIEALPDAKFLINVSNDAWFGDSLAPHQHLEIARSRAIETGRYLLRATNTGISAIIAPDGSIINKSVQFKEDVIRAKIQPYSGLTPYSRWGNWGIVTILFGIMFIICLYQWKMQQRKQA